MWKRCCAASRRRNAVAVSNTAMSPEWQSISPLIAKQWPKKNMTTNRITKITMLLRLAAVTAMWCHDVQAPYLCCNLSSMKQTLARASMNLSNGLVGIIRLCMGRDIQNQPSKCYFRSKFIYSWLAHSHCSLRGFTSLIWLDTSRLLLPALWQPLRCIAIFSRLQHSLQAIYDSGHSK